MSGYDDGIFDYKLLHPAMALIRIPADPNGNPTAPTMQDEFGTGFFVKKEGVLVTAAHNLTEDGEPAGKPLPWVWVCLYNGSDQDWTDALRVDVDPRLIDARLDAAILKVRAQKVATLPVVSDWGRGDEAVVLGFQPNTGRKSGFDLRPMLCQIPMNWPVAPLDLEEHDEPALRIAPLLLEWGQQPLGKGMSGGPVLTRGEPTLSRRSMGGGPVLSGGSRGSSVIALEKGIDYAEGQLRSPEVKSTALRWFQGEMRRLLPPPTRRRRPAPSVIPASGFLAPWFRWREERRALRRYLDRLILEHRHFTFLGRAKPLDLEQIYISLKIGEYVPPRERPDERAARMAVGHVESRSGTVDLTEALMLDPPRLVILGEPGSGKTTLLKHLALRLAARDPALGEFARKHVPNFRARWADRWHRRVESSAFGLALSLRPYGTRPILRALRWLCDRWTKYPLPFFLTLNDQANGTEALEERLSRPLVDAGFPAARSFLHRQRLAGKCVFLLDALDEVVDSQLRADTADWIGSAGVQERNPVLVTCRNAAFEADRPERQFPGFRRLEVQEITDREVERFIENWFGDRTPGDQRQHVERLLTAMGRNPRMRLLAANPLLLSLMALCFERDWSLPERRVELYEKCTHMLLGEWDESKGPGLSAGFDRATKLAALQCAGVRAHERGLQQFSRDFLELAIRPALSGRSEVERDRFLEELMLRSNLIRRKSRTSYDFAHLTFQEYFAARDFADRGDEDALLAHLDDPWWREVILLFSGLQKDAAALLERLRRHDLLLAAAALADARAAASPEFTQVAGGIIEALKSLMRTDDLRRQHAADALAALPREEIRAYLVEQSQGEQRPDVVLAAVLALYRTVDRITLSRLWPTHGPILRVLHGALDRQGDERSERILAVLGRLGFEWVFVPAGDFVMGEGNRSRIVHLGDYWIGKYPVTNAQFARFVEETQYAAGDGWRKAFMPGKERHPVVCMSWHDATAFCEWAGVDLPSEEQWEKAARGSDGRTYPWGNQWEADRCSAESKGTTPVDQFRAGASPFGCYDMVGNVWEWCADEVEWPYALRVLRGGSWDHFAGDVHAASHSVLDAYHRYADFGFRCAGFRRSGSVSEHHAPGVIARNSFPRPAGSQR
jgi:hypothetical protein